jgi:sugar phosphate isomerase/epimerase
MDIYGILFRRRQQRRMMMRIAMVTGYAEDAGAADECLSSIAGAGFSVFQWTHHWNRDFLYGDSEIRHIVDLKDSLGLSLRDVHGAVGPEKSWFSELEYQRIAGVELVRNRISLCAALDGSVLVMHVPRFIPENAKRWSQLRKSLDELEPRCREKSIRIAVENMRQDDFRGIEELLESYSPEFLGLCYDSGHGNIGNDGPGHLEKISDRLLAVHLHDNDGFDDQHRPLFTGTVDWERLASILAESTYEGYLTVEVHRKIFTEAEPKSTFLVGSHQAAEKFLEMIKQHRS